MPRLRHHYRQDDNVPTFLAKTYDMLEKPENNNVIGWSPDGTEFQVKSVNEFTSRILPRYFKHNNYASFIRQLNMYGFHKVKSQTPYQCFRHELFVKGKRQSLKDIKRRANNEQAIEEEPPREDSKEQESAVDLEVADQANKIDNMKRKQDELEKVVDILLEQNKEILMDNKHLWNKMKKTIEKEEKKLENIILLLLIGSGKSLTDQPTNQLQEDESEPIIPNNALLPMEDNKAKRMALETIYNQLQSKRRSRSKNKYKDQLFLLKQQDHMNILNNLVHRSNQLKQDFTRQEPLQIEGTDQHNRQLMMMPQPPLERALSESHDNAELPRLPLTPKISEINQPLSPLDSPFLMRKESDCLEQDQAINRFILNRSDDEYLMRSKQHSVVEHQAE